MRVLRAAAVPLVLTLLLALSGVVLGRIYADALLTQLVAGAAVGSVAVGLATRRLPSWAPAPVSVLLLAGYAVLALHLAAERAALTAPLPELMGDALRNGIPRLLTAMIPVEPTPDTVAVPVIAVWLSGLAATELAVRGGRVLLGCAAPAALYGAALYVVGPNATRAAWPTVAFAAGVAMALAAGVRGGATAAGLPPTDTPPTDTMPTGSLSASTLRAVRLRAATATAVGLAVVVGLVAAVGPWLSGQVSRTPVDPRQYVQPPQVDSLDESPLNRLSGWALDPGRRLFDLSPVGGTVPSPQPSGTTSRVPRVRLAVLPDYDGVTWRVGATYRNAGRVLPTEPPRTGARVERIEQQITIGELTGRLLPIVPTPSSVEGTRVAYDTGSGTLIRPEGLSGGLRYTVTSTVETPDGNLLPTAGVPAGEPVARYLHLGDKVPEQLQRLADQLAKDNGAPFDRATAAEDFLREHYRLVADAPSGHAFPNLAFFLFGPRDGGGQQGTSEQFAASFAVLGRLMGLPTRVVVGFTAKAGGGPVTAGEAVAWPEVLFDDVGWYAFDPRPRPAIEPRPVEEDFAAKPSNPPAPSEVPSPTATPTASAGPVGAPVDAGRTGVGAATVVAGVAGATVLLVAAALATVVLLRRGLRRRRLTAATPAERITGAWLEFTDALRLAGRPALHHLSATEVADHAIAVSAQPIGRRPAGPPTSGMPTRGAPDGRAPDSWAPDDTVAIRRGAPRSGPNRMVVAASDGAIAAGMDSTLASGADRATASGAGADGLVAEEAQLLDDLVTGLNVSAFAPTAVDEGQAERAAAQAVAFADDLRGRRSWWRRLWWRIHPGPLRWHRH